MKVNHPDRLVAQRRHDWVYGGHWKRIGPKEVGICGGVAAQQLNTAVGEGIRRHQLADSLDGTRRRAPINKSCLSLCRFCRPRSRTIFSVGVERRFSRVPQPRDATAHKFGRCLIRAGESVWWGEATDEPAREDARPTEKPN